MRVVVLTGSGNYFAITAAHQQYTAPTRLSYREKLGGQEKHSLD